MDKEELLMKLLETVGRARRGHGGKGKNTRKTHDDREKSTKRHHKMSPVWENTMILLYHEGSMNQRTIAHRMNVTGQAVSEMMKKFEEHGLIVREAGELNNENIVSLTETGMEKGKEFQEKITKLAEKMFVQFTEEELITLSLLLEKMEIDEELS